ncbi:unnamed protein product [Somion occarium]|uniref:Uncharacterized protein n=1 Tax=Somion occarium TaxID=3059160 RepID=A0ABP1DYJ5_9APHY
MSHRSQYHPLLSDDPANVEEKQRQTPLMQSSISSPRRLLLIFGFTLQGILVVTLCFALWVKNKPDCPFNPVYPQVLYSPAQEALKYQPKTFDMGFGRSKTIYQGEPSEEVDSAWLDLYNVFGLSKIPKWQARLLPNKTLPIPGDEQNYAVGLAVFHQLHCLNMIRQGLYPEYYRDPVTGSIAGFPAEEWPDHVSHCLDNIRQSIMCASDISLIVWQWFEEDNRASIMMNTVHSCRNFDNIVDWAKAHRRGHKFDLNVHVQDDIEIPVF